MPSVHTPWSRRLDAINRCSSSSPSPPVDCHAKRQRASSPPPSSSSNSSSSNSDTAAELFHLIRFNTTLQEDVVKSVMNSLAPSLLQQLLAQPIHHQTPPLMAGSNHHLGLFPFHTPPPPPSSPPPPRLPQLQKHPKSSIFLSIEITLRIDCIELGHASPKALDMLMTNRNTTLDNCMSVAVHQWLSSTLQRTDPSEPQDDHPIHQQRGQQQTIMDAEYFTFLTNLSQHFGALDPQWLQQMQCNVTVVPLTIPTRFISSFCRGEQDDIPSPCSGRVAAGYHHRFRSGGQNPSSKARWQNIVADVVVTSIQMHSTTSVEVCDVSPRRWTIGVRSPYVVSLSKLPQDDQRRIARLGHRFTFVGRQNISCDRSGISDNQRLAVEVTGLTYDLTIPLMLLPMDAMHQLTSEQVSFSSALEMWSGVSRVWRSLATTTGRTPSSSPTTAAVVFPRLLPSHGALMPVACTVVLLSASMPKSALHATLLFRDTSLSQDVSQFLCGLEELTGATKCFSSASSWNEPLVPTLSSYVSGMESLHSGILHRVTGTTMCIPDLRAVPPQNLKTLSRFQREEAVVIRHDKLKCDIIAALNFATLASVSTHPGASNGKGGNDSLEEFMRHCDLVIPVPLPPLDVQLQEALAASVPSPSLYEGQRQSSIDDGFLLAWGKLLQILGHDVRSLFSAPQVTVPATMLLSRYFQAVKAAFPDGVHVSLMGTLMKIASAHAVLRVAWSVHHGIMLVEPLFSSCVEVLVVDALFSVSCVDQSLEYKLQQGLLHVNVVDDALRNGSLMAASEVSGSSQSAMVNAWQSDYLAKLLDNLQE